MEELRSRPQAIYKSRNVEFWGRQSRVKNIVINSVQFEALRIPNCHPISRPYINRAYINLDTQPPLFYILQSQSEFMSVVSFIAHLSAA